MYELIKKFMVFFLAGGAATIFNYSIFLLLLWSGLNPLFASGVGYSSGVLVSYLLNARLNFKETTASISGFVRYAAMYSIALPIQILLLATLIDFGIMPELANAISLLVIMVPMFLIVRRYVFGATGRG